MIKAVIFDLDNCLADASEAGADLFKPALDAMRQAGRGRLSGAAIERALADVWIHPLDWVATQHRLPEEMLVAGWRIFGTLEVTRPLRGYGDLALVASLPAQRFLVTSGFRRLQESKIRMLNLAGFFASVHVDAIDEPGRPGKQKIFEQILQDHGLAAADVLIVGDNADSEIAVGNRLGIKTVQTLRPGVLRASNATYHIESLTELQLLIGNPAG
jgi:putative hydrolase of the HAD superfamily